MTLLELLVGVTIGLLVVGAAIGTLVVSRGTASTITEVSQLQQQAAYALRVIGEQLRTAGSLELVESSAGSGRFGFRNFAGVPVGGVSLAGISVNGTDGTSGAPDTLVVANQGSRLPSLRKDCGNANVSFFQINPATFSVSGSSLMCQGTSFADPVIGNVADFQVNYRVNMGTTAAPVLRLLTPSQMTSPEHWQHVRAIEICLDLQGSVNTPDAGVTYLNCQGVAASRNNRVHVVSRNVFNLRKQDLLEVALP